MDDNHKKEELLKEEDHKKEKLPHREKSERRI